LEIKNLHRVAGAHRGQRRPHDYHRNRKSLRSGSYGAGGRLRNFYQLAKPSQDRRVFGEKVFDVIETTPDRLRDVDGIGPLRAASILAAWAEQKIVREIMVFLQSHGVNTARAVRIFKTYGADAPQVMTQNLRCGRVFSRLT
jgi:hypothetical protein